MNRRSFLQCASGGFVAMSGCSQFLSDDEDCDAMNTTMIDVERVTLTDEQKSRIYPILYSELTDEQQEIITIAMDTRKYKTCPPEPEAVAALIGLATDRIDQQIEDYGQSKEDVAQASAYVKKDGTLFELRITVEDLAVSG